MNRRLCLILLSTASLVGSRVCADDWPDLTQVPGGPVPRQAVREHATPVEFVNAPNSVAPNSVAARTRVPRNEIPIGPRPGAATGESGTASTSGGGLSPGSVLAALSFVILLILGLARLFVRKNPYSVGGVPQEAVDVLGRRTIDPRNSVYVIKVGSKIVLLGSSSNGMNTLSEITDPIEVATLSNLCRAEQSRHADSANWLTRLVQRAERPASDSHNFAARFGGRLAQDSHTQALQPAAPQAEGRRVA